MRIGLDGTPLLGNRSGVGNYTGRLVAALLKLNPDWEYLLYSNRPLGDLEPDLASATQVKGYLPQSRWFWMQAKLPRVIKESQPHLCHFTNALAPFRQSKPYVLNIHDASLFLYSHTHPNTRLLALRILLPLLARRAAAVITMSEHARRDLRHVLRLPAEKIHVVHLAAPTNFRRVQDAHELLFLRQKYRLPEEFLLFVGTLEPRKNLVRLLRAFGRLRQRGYRHKLILTGPRGWLMEDFEREIERLGLEQAVQYTGYVPVADLPGLFTLATLFVFPSLYEGFGLPPLEAMACGTAVLSSNNSSLVEVCGDAAHLVNSNDENSLTEGLIMLLSDDEWRAELGRRGLERARQFSWERTAQATMAIYQQVLRR